MNGAVKQQVNMNIKVKKSMQKIARSFGGGLVSAQKLDNLVDGESNSVQLMKYILQQNHGASPSKAQLRQDIFVLYSTNFKRNGFFVEFGATDGVGLSNTYLLEKNYGWTGVLAEPAQSYHDDLTKNRDAKIDFSCVWSKSNEILKFNMVDRGELSTIVEFNDCDCHGKYRKSGTIYDVETISLNDLLKKHDAPRNIDFLSIDTEGSEYEILSNFDFDAYDISIITCEHNNTDSREKIFELLTKNGYIRVFEEYTRWDDWFIRKLP